MGRSGKGSHQTVSHRGHVGKKPAQGKMTNLEKPRDLRFFAQNAPLPVKELTAAELVMREALAMNVVALLTPR